MIQRKISKIIGAAIIATLLFSTFTAAGMNLESNEQPIAETKLTDRPYDGHLRVYVVEPISRFDNYDGDPYHFGFLDFAIDEQLSIDYLDTYTKQVTWDAQQAGYSNVEEQNIIVMAAVFYPESVKRYAYPPATNPFDAYYVDAAAAAIPGETGYNFKNETFSHTVFCEEGTATWCKYCPVAAENLKTVYDTYDYPFYFVAMIEEIPKAKNRLKNDLDLYGYPTSYFDSGYKVVVGGSTVNTFKNRVISCGSRDVHEMDLSISLTWAGNGILDIEVIITNNEEMPNTAPDDPEVSGPSTGSPGIAYDYSFVTTDPDGDDVFYCVDWGDDTGEVCIGPFASGEAVIVSHTWSTKGTYTVKVKAKDAEDHESDWTELTVRMPRSRAFLNPLITRLLEKFPLLQRLLNF
ncbi:MAG: PKD domain-containing protein [Thermoplasmatales archaeon]|nr:PKD domain-containing protein [Thermoplasmatales archaeon]